MVCKPMISFLVSKGKEIHSGYDTITNYEGKTIVESLTKDHDQDSLDFIKSLKISSKEPQKKGKF